MMMYLKFSLTPNNLYNTKNLEPKYNVVREAA